MYLDKKRIENDLETFVRKNEIQNFMFIYNRKKMLDISYEDSYILRLSVKLKRYDIVKLLVKHEDINIFAKNGQSFNTAYENKDFKMLKILVHSDCFNNSKNEILKNKFRKLFLEVNIKEF